MQWQGTEVQKVHRGLIKEVCAEPTSEKNVDVCCEL